MRKLQSRETIWEQSGFDNGKYYLEIVSETIFAVCYDGESELLFQLGQLVKSVGDNHDGILVGTTGHIISIRDPDLAENRYSGGNDSSNGEYILDIMFDSFPMYLPVEYDEKKEVHSGGYRRRTLWQVEAAPLPEFPGTEKP